MKGTRIFLVGLLAFWLSVCQPVFAETREECKDRVYEKTNLAAGAAGGGLAGKIVGASACTGFLVAVFVDFGLSYVGCVGISAALGGVVGTFMAESINKEQLRQCDKLSK